MPPVFPLPFSPDYTFAARRPLTLNGVSYVAGQIVNTEGLPVHVLRRMYDTRYVTPVADSDVVPGATNPADALPTPIEAQTPAAGNYKAMHKGFGRWYVVDENGDVIEGPFPTDDGKGEATARSVAAEMNRKATPNAA